MNTTVESPIAFDDANMSLSDMVERLLRIGPSPGEFLDQFYKVVDTYPSLATNRLRGHFSYINNPRKWRHDIDAVKAFIARYDNSFATRRRYALEIDRLLLWTLVAVRKTLSDLTEEDSEQFRNFLKKQNIEESQMKWWCGPRRARFARRNGTYTPNPLWRPFTSRPMTEVARKHSLNIVRIFFHWLRNERYLSQDSFRETRHRTHPRKAVQLVADRPISHLEGPERFTAGPWIRTHHPRPSAENSPEEFEAGLYYSPPLLSRSAWGSVFQYVSELCLDTSCDEARFQQMRFNIVGIYSTGAKLTEWVIHNMRSFFLDRDGKFCWMAQQTERTPPAKVIVLPPFYSIFVEYREFLGLPPLSLAEEDIPLAVARNGGRIPDEPTGLSRRRGFGVRQLRSLVQQALQETAKVEQDPAIIEELERARPSWLRHSATAHLLEAGQAPLEVQMFARHRSLAETSRYLEWISQRNASSGP